MTRARIFISFLNLLFAVLLLCTWDHHDGVSFSQLCLTGSFSAYLATVLSEYDAEDRVRRAASDCYTYEDPADKDEEEKCGCGV